MVSISNFSEFTLICMILHTTLCSHYDHNVYTELSFIKDSVFKQKFYQTIIMFGPRVWSVLQMFLLVKNVLSISLFTHYPYYR